MSQGKKYVYVRAHLRKSAAKMSEKPEKSKKLPEVGTILKFLQPASSTLMHSPSPPVTRIKIKRRNRRLRCNLEHTLIGVTAPDGSWMIEVPVHPNPMRKWEVVDLLPSRTRLPLPPPTPPESVFLTPP